MLFPSKFLISHKPVFPLKSIFPINFLSNFYKQQMYVSSFLSFVLIKLENFQIYKSPFFIFTCKKLKRIRQMLRLPSCVFLVCQSRLINTSYLLNSIYGTSPNHLFFCLCIFIGNVHVYFILPSTLTVSFASFC